MIMRKNPLAKLFSLFAKLKGLLARLFSPLGKLFKPVSRLLDRLWENRWLYTFTASCMATIVGISLTFGLNSCRETRRARQEARESIIQAVENLHSRSLDIDDYLETISLQDSLYLEVSNLWYSDQQVPDSLVVAFGKALFSIRSNSSDQSFEKIFRESYQLWEVLDQDELTEMIRSAYVETNELEEYCISHNQMLQQKLEDCEFGNFMWKSKGEILEKVKENEKFGYYMAIRNACTQGFKVVNEDHHKDLVKIDSICKTLGYPIGKIEKSSLEVTTNNTGTTVDR